MPTIAQIDGLRVVVYPNDHRPAHVHVMGRGCEAVFVLHCPHGPVALRESLGFGRHELSRIAAELNAQLPGCCRAWRQIHGHA